MRLILTLLFLAFLSAASQAQWGSDSTTNTPVCTAASIQDYPTICSDGADGAIIAWEDIRANGAYLIYAQRLGPDGKPMWRKDGVQMTYHSNFNQRYPVIASDGKGGAYVVWQDNRNVANGIDLYAQHINSAGVIMYDSVGKPIGYGPGDQTNQKIVADGFGNAFVVWEDNRSTVTSTNPDIYMNRLMPTKILLDTTGGILSGQANKQRRPQICDDGHGGFCAAWESDATTPTAIYAQRVDSTGKLLWTTPYGIDVYQGTNGLQNAKDVSIRRDSNQIMLAWEAANVSASNGQDIYATRLMLNGTKLYSSDAVQVTGDWPGNQINPQIFSDDSSEVGVSGYSGMLVLFEDYSLTPPALQMVRMLGDGNGRQPTSGFYRVSYDKSAESGFRALRVAPGGVMTVWNDARIDSTIYAQRVDRTMQRDFHSTGTPSLWGLPVSVHATQSKQVVMTSRTNGAIMAWTDYRNGGADIYAQLVFKDGSLPVPPVLSSPVTMVVSRTGSFDGSQCNARCTNALAVDTGATPTGVDSILSVVMNNLQLSVPKFTIGADSAAYSVCVIDSLQNGTGTVRIVNGSSNAVTTNFAYCTIADTLVPMVQIDTLPDGVHIALHDARPWDRGLRPIELLDSSNVIFTPSLDALQPGSTSFSTVATRPDPHHDSRFSIVPRDLAGNDAPLYTYLKKADAGVAPQPNDAMSLSIIPSSVSGSATIMLMGAPFADVTVFDVLGRPVDRFRVEGSYEWRPRSLAAGTYVVRANMGDGVVIKRIVKE